MTPLENAFADAPRRRYERWRTACLILACSLASMTVAVVGMAWQASRLTRERNQADATYSMGSPADMSGASLDRRCRAYLATRESNDPAVRALRATTVNDCHVLYRMHTLQKTWVTESPLAWPSRAEIRDEIAGHCMLLGKMEPSALRDAQARDCATLARMRATSTGLYAP